MSRNPYSPPQAAVADAPAPGPPCPGNVTAALWLMGAAFFASPLVSIHEAVYTGSGIGAVAGIVTLALVYVLMIALGFWVFSAVVKGRRWGRIVASIVALLEIVSVGSAFLRGIALYGWPVRLLDLFLLCGAVVLFFTPPANAWFRRRD
jgi:hypothetical protein